MFSFFWQAFHLLSVKLPWDTCAPFYQVCVPYRTQSPDWVSEKVNGTEDTETDRVTNATLFCGNIEPTRVRWKSHQVHTTTL